MLFGVGLAVFSLPSRRTPAMTRGVLRSSVLWRVRAMVRIVLRGVEDVAALPDVEQEAQRGSA